MNETLILKNIDRTDKPKITSKIIGQGNIPINLMMDISWDFLDEIAKLGCFVVIKNEDDTVSKISNEELMFYYSVLKK